MHLSLLLSILPLALAGPTGKRSEPAPLLVPGGDAADLVSGEYIVKLKEGSAVAALDDALSLLRGKPLQMYDAVFKGFSGNFDKKTVDLLRMHPDVCTPGSCLDPTCVAIYANQNIGRVHRAQRQGLGFRLGQADRRSMGPRSDFPPSKGIDRVRL